METWPRLLLGTRTKNGAKADWRVHSKILKGSLSNDDGDGNENGNKPTGLD